MVLGARPKRHRIGPKKAVNAVDTNSRFEPIHGIGMFPTASF